MTTTGDPNNRRRTDTAIEIFRRRPGLWALTVETWWVPRERDDNGSQDR